MSTKNSGTLHPLTQAIREAVSIFDKLGFEVALGPELEDEWHNFDALNIPQDHPARDMQDTFWLKRNEASTSKGKDFSRSKEYNRRLLLRTHTSPVQIRYMETHKPPIRIIAPGKVFRNEATDSTHEAQFFQLEGLYVDREVSMAHLKGSIEHFVKNFFDQDTEVRFRPSYFPFVEPGIEVGVKRNDKWLEMMGAGMVHPSVLQMSGHDPRIWRGFAFGFGLDRLVMVKTGLTDIRYLFHGDIRVLAQF
jgi:phenylalanyl-tRNA synthetase alpha chain